MQDPPEDNLKEILKANKKNKLEFIKLYLQEDFLTSFYNRNLQSIKDYGFIIKRYDLRNQDYVLYKVRFNIKIITL